MTIRFLSAEVSPPLVRVLDHVRRLLDGHDIELVGTISANLLLEVLLIDCRGIAEIDVALDDLLAQLKKLARERLEDAESCR
jgi:hypothetical protein